jgi:hypothetical protein
MTRTEPLKPPVGKLLLFAGESFCFKCRRTTRKVIVQSRSGGFVSQDCESCGASRYLPEGALPALTCTKCRRPVAKYRDVFSNYAYRCAPCGVQFRLWDVVPSWQELNFDFDGLSIDPEYRRLSDAGAHADVDRR